MKCEQRKHQLKSTGKIYEIEDTIPIMRMNKIASTRFFYSSTHYTVHRLFIYFNGNLAILYLFLVVVGPFEKKMITIQIRYAVVCFGMDTLCVVQRNVYAMLVDMRICILSQIRKLAKKRDIKTVSCN